MFEKMSLHLYGTFFSGLATVTFVCGLSEFTKDLLALIFLVRVFGDAF